MFCVRLSIYIIYDDMGVEGMAEVVVKGGPGGGGVRQGEEEKGVTLFNLSKRLW